jgi:His-Xaa-Ser system protein HxsD
MDLKYEKELHGVRFELDEGVYPRPVSIAAGYRFLDRCYLRFERAGKNRLSVLVKGKQKLSRTALEALADEFHNELLQQLIRHQVSERTASLRDAIVGKALFSAEPAEPAEPAEAAPGPAFETDSQADLDYLDDPLGIAVPWEEKYGDGQEKGGGQGTGQGE